MSIKGSSLMRGLLLVVVALGLTLSQASAGDTTVIAAFGDSLFAGFGIKPEEAFPARLETKLNKDGYHVHVINDGISGDTTAGGSSRIDSVLAQKPDLVLVELGANDMLRGLDPEQVRANLDAILSRLHAAGIRILVVGQKAPLSYGKHYAGSFDSLFCELAKKYDAGCYPVYLEGAYGHADLMQADGIHPNADGVKVILDKVYPSVTSLLKKK